MVEKELGNLFIVAAPSGGGKTSLVRQLTSQLTDIEVSISYTTRPPRPAEENGVDYFFIDEQEFNRMIDAEAFVEYAHVFHHLYGTAVAQIYDRLQAGIDVVLDIDWQGAQHIKRLFAQAVGIFILPPSLDTLQQRLLARRQDDDQVIQNRMARACEEMSHYADFDYLVVNDHFEKAASDLIAIVVAHRLQKSRQVIRQRKLLSFLLSSQ